MLSYDEALGRVLEAVMGPLSAEAVLLGDAAGRALAADVFAETDLPPFDNTAIDGYALRAADTEGASPEKPVVLRVTQTVAAGTYSERPVGAGEAARIFTGAPLPPGADALVMVEDTETADGGHTVRLFAPGSASFIRRAGSDISSGTRALSAGTTLDAGAVGLLSALNRADVPCARLPRVGLLTTGDEVVPPGPEPLLPGQIRDANGPALVVAVQEAGADLTLRRHASDTKADVRRALEEMADCDVILASGGVSVGDYDYVKKVVGEVGTLDFWRIAIKPGKPLAFGKVGNALFFGLPGNPVSSLVTFELFVRPLLRKLAGYTQVTRPIVSAVLSGAGPHTPGRREFIRARLVWNGDTYHAMPTGAQGSHRLTSLTGADALLIAHEDRGDYSPGERLPAMLLY